jgi:peptidoglycan/LPS O-acetylase OafA/YrhL
MNKVPGYPDSKSHYKGRAKRFGSLDSTGGIEIRPEIPRQSLFQNRLKLLLCYLALIFSSCYTVNEHTYLRIVFNESKLSAVYLNSYVDSVRNNGIIIPDSIKEFFFNGDKISDNERLIYFESSPQEWYLINFDATPCWIEAIYSPLVSNGMIYDKRFIQFIFIKQFMNKVPGYPDSKSHYQILDGLRGVAAVLVVIFHVFETYSGNRFNQIINHGYLAVDFFFLLSGFVVAYAYDDRWGKMTQWDFYKRRLIRLQPMVIMGTLIGAALFYFQAGAAFPLIAATPIWKMLLVMVVGFTMIPLLPSMDIRGWQEMHPLNGPAWSLFFEYIANILYALIIRKFSKKALAVFVILSALLLIRYTTMGPQGDLIGGWSVDKTQLNIGFTRLLYPFFAGVLLCRMGKLIHIKSAFAVCSVLLVGLLSVPRIGGSQHLWMNGIYESVCIIIFFPLIVSIGAGGNLTGKFATKACTFLGAISYPIYITHYPLIYLHIAWVTKYKVPMATGLLGGLVLVVVSIAIAWASLKLYDEPVRNWLAKRFLMKKA